VLDILGAICITNRENETYIQSCLHLFLTCVLNCMASCSEGYSCQLHENLGSHVVIVRFWFVLSICGSTALCWALAAISVSWSLYTVGRTPWTGDQPVARTLHAHRTAYKHRISTQTSMPWAEIEPTIPAFERAKTVHTLDCAAAVIGTLVWSNTHEFSYLPTFTRHSLNLI
jgi:hypothetical protein